MGGILIAELLGVNGIDLESGHSWGRERVGVQIADPRLETLDSRTQFDPIRFGIGDPPDVNPGRETRDASREFDDSGIVGDPDFSVTRSATVEDEGLEATGHQNGAPCLTGQEVFLVEAAGSRPGGALMGEGDEQKSGEQSEEGSHLPQ
jgi:hypothetical protein